MAGSGTNPRNDGAERRIQGDGGRGAVRERKALTEGTELGGTEGWEVGACRRCRKEVGAGREDSAGLAVTVSPPPGVGVPGDAAGAAPRRVLPQDLAFPPAPAPWRPEPGPAVAARGPRDATQQRQALLGRRGRGRGRARGSAAPPGRPRASWGTPAPGSHALHARARLPGVQAHPGAASFRGRGAPAWPGHSGRSHQPASAAAWTHRTPRAD